jgi:hypothetical protein
MSARHAQLFQHSVMGPTVMGCGMVALLLQVLMVPYDKLDVDASYATAFRQVSVHLATCIPSAPSLIWCGRGRQQQLTPMRETSACAANPAVDVDARSSFNYFAGKFC